MTGHKPYLGLLLAGLLLAAGCSSPEERFASAAAKANIATDPKVLKCAGEKLKTKLSPEQFDELIEDLELIAAKKKSVSDANVKLMGAMTVATGACTVSGAIDGIFGGGDKES